MAQDGPPPCLPAGFPSLHRSCEPATDGRRASERVCVSVCAATCLAAGLGWREWRRGLILAGVEKSLGLGICRLASEMVLAVECKLWVNLEPGVPVCCPPPSPLPCRQAKWGLCEQPGLCRSLRRKPPHQPARVGLSLFPSRRCRRRRRFPSLGELNRPLSAGFRAARCPPWTKLSGQCSALCAAQSLSGGPPIRAAGGGGLHSGHSALLLRGGRKG